MAISNAVGNTGESITQYLDKLIAKQSGIPSHKSEHTSCLSSKYKLQTKNPPCVYSHKN